MEQPNDFLFRLIIGRTNYDLIQSPIGWEEQLIKFTRSPTYYGIIRDYTIPLKFVTDGAKILRSQYYQYGIEAFVRLEILQLDRNTWEYNKLYIGEIDFSECEDTLTDFSCNVMEGGVTKLIKAYENVKYEIPIDVPEALDTRLPGIGFSDYSNSIFVPTEFRIRPFFPAVNLVINELNSGSALTQSTLFVDGDDPSPTDWIAKSNQNGLLVRVFGDFIIAKNNRDNPVSVELLVTNSTATTILQTITIYNFNKLGQFTVNYDKNIQMDNGNLLFFRVNFLVITLKLAVIQEGTINLSYSVVTPDIECKTLRPKYVLEQILRKMNNGNPIPVRSFVLENTKWKDVVLTSGNGIRSLQGAKIKTSFKDFFQSYSSQICAGIGVENENVVFEERPYFYTEVVQIADVGEVKEIKIEPAKDYFYNSIKVGYKNQTYEENNGQDEFNSGQEWTLPITRITKDLNLVSVYRADVRGIEEIRRKLIESGTDTTDNESDNDVFMIKLKPLPEPGFDYYKPEGIEAYTLVQGVENADRIYNLDLSPKKMIIRNFPFIDSFLDNLGGTLIRFQSADKNAELATTDLNGNYVKENIDIQVDTLTGAYFKPLTAIFTANSPRNIQELIKNKPYGSIIFSYQGNEYKGFILDVSSDVSKNEERDFELLLTSSNNLLNLVR